MMTFVRLLCVNVTCVTLSCVDMLECVCVCTCGHWDGNVLKAECAACVCVCVLRACMCVADGMEATKSLESTSVLGDSRIGIIFHGRSIGNFSFNML